METCIDYTDHTVAVVSTDEAKWHRRLREFKAKYPDQVRIKHEPEGNDGNMVAEVLVQWIKIRPPRVCNLTEEEKAIRAEKLRSARQYAGENDNPWSDEDAK